MAVLPPGPRQVPRSHAGRLHELETRRQSAQQKPASEDELIVFSHAGALATSTSGPYVPLRKGRLFYVLCVLGTAGSSSTVVSIKKNGSEITTVTLASSDTIEAKNLSTSFAVGADKLTIGITTVGTGAADLTVECRFS
jgi:hypothetical protein